MIITGPLFGQKMHFLKKNLKNNFFLQILDLFDRFLTVFTNLELRRFFFMHKCDSELSL